MITGELRTKIDAVWNDFWSGGVSNPFRDDNALIGSCAEVIRDILDYYGKHLDDDATRRLDLTLDEGRARAATST